ncbi:hypothetical protein AB833_15390 [Chromatiales bacterium (ex Bugula neritina AB1)]|nr:hypothetical protein AB833_15390 [Chromatiales bacterium (ex Bugula neritina AB1)]
MTTHFARYVFFTPLVLSLLISCSSEGIDRNLDALEGLPSHSDGASTTGVGPDLGSPLDRPGPRRYVLLEQLNFEATLPSIISILFHASDQYGNAISGLQTSDFTLLEDQTEISRTETSLSIVPHQELPFTLQTVVMIDVSSSIQPADLDKMKTAVKALLVNDEGTSRLLPQQEIALFTFNDTITQLKGFSSSTQSLVEAVDSIQPAIAITPTDFYGAIIQGTSQWTDNFDLSSIVQGTLIIITDGTDTASRHTLRDAVSAVRGKSVYTLGVGSEISREALSAIGTSGSHALVNFSELRNALESINAQVKNAANSFYYLHYASPKRKAEGANASSSHSIRLSVLDNANQTSSGTISGVFDSTEFSNVSAEVIIAGPRRLELQQTATLRASTRWGPSPDANYIWSLNDNNFSCSMDVVTNNVVRITGVAEGNCTIQAQDTSAGGVRNWHSVTVTGN